MNHQLNPLLSSLIQLLLLWRLIFLWWKCFIFIYLSIYIIYISNILPIYKYILYIHMWAELHFLWCAFFFLFCIIHTLVRLQSSKTNGSLEKEYIYIYIFFKGWEKTSQKNKRENIPWTSVPVMKPKKQRSRLLTFFSHAALHLFILNQSERNDN